MKKNNPGRCSGFSLLARLKGMTTTKLIEKAQDKLITFMVRPFDKALLSVGEGLTTHRERNQHKPFVLSLSKDLIEVAA